MVELNMKRERRVDFMIVGAQKCGTTTLAKIFKNHASVVGCSNKEPMFFCSTQNWRQELSRYHALYEWQEKALHFEASTTYSIYPHAKSGMVWMKLHAYNPDLKIIYIVRNPLERIVSSYMHLYERGYIDLNLKQAIVEKPILLNITRYATQIKPFIKQFGADNVLILFFDELVENRNLVIRKLCDFLNISPEGFQNQDDIHANKSIGGYKRHHKYDNPGFILDGVRQYFPLLWNLITDNSARSFKRKPVLEPDSQEMILYLLRKEINELEILTDKNLNSWRTVKESEDLTVDYHLNWYESKLKLFNRIKKKLKRSVPQLKK